MTWALRRRLISELVRNDFRLSLDVVVPCSSQPASVLTLGVAARLFLCLACHLGVGVEPAPWPIRAAVFAPLPLLCLHVSDCRFQSLRCSACSRLFRQPLVGGLSPDAGACIFGSWADVIISFSLFLPGRLLVGASPPFSFFIWVHRARPQSELSSARRTGARLLTPSCTHLTQGRNTPMTWA